MVVVKNKRQQGCPRPYIAILQAQEQALSNLLNL